MPHASLPRYFLAAALAVLAAPSGVAQAADDASLRNCRSISAAAARLACYDSLPLGSSAAVATAAGSGTGIAAAPTSVAATSGSPATFGLARITGEPDSVQSRIEGTFIGWSPGTDFRLANGQVWRVDDGSEGFYNLNSPAVTVKRGVMGSFRLEIDGAGKAPRVKRVE